MKAITFTRDGALVEITVKAADRINQLVTDLRGIAVELDGLLTVEKDDVAHVQHGGKTGGNRAKPEKNGRKRTKPTGGTRRGNRNKKCAACGRAFFDDTRTNCRKWCGIGGCRKDELEKSGHAEAARVHASAAAAGPLRTTKEP